ncbi:DUF2608 domain-containing protein [Chlamydia vaughanii]|uniref:DUF2608 domain-containing protein n=1 Tax=Chlamydia vaughanii TaxID=3112552 RepID=UPI0032B1A2E8
MLFLTNYLSRMSLLAVVIFSTWSVVEAAQNRPMEVTMAYSFGDVFSYIGELDSEAIFCINIDSIIQHKYLGSPGWHESRLSKLSQRFGDFFKGKKRIAEEQVVIDTLIDKKCLEEHFLKEFEKLLELCPCPLLGISSLGIESVPSTLKNLKACGIDFTAQECCRENFFLDSSEKCTESALVQNGILFCSGLPVGEIIKKLFTLKNIKPKRIVFLSDDPEHIKAFGRECIEVGLTFLGIVYYPAAESIFHYIYPYSTAVEMQEEHVLTVISNEMAQLSLDSLNQKS